MAPEGLFSKDPVTCWARKAVLEPMICLPTNAALLMFLIKETVK